MSVNEPVRLTARLTQQRLTAKLSPVTLDARFGAGVPIPGPPGPEGPPGQDGQDGADSTVPGPQGPKGDPGAASTVPGPPGTNGANGLAATVAVGSTTTGSPGTNASVVNTGSTSAAVFQFTIPRGDWGATGAQGQQGIPGQAATVAVGVTATGVPGTSATVVNAGTSAAAIFHFTIPRGDVGATGAASTVPGPAGPQGVPGPVGEDSTVPGPPGPEGEKGDPGTGIVIKGSVPSSDELPLTGTPGDAWIAADTGNLWVWSIPDTAQQIALDMVGVHEGNPHGVPTSFGWYYAPFVEMGNDPEGSLAINHWLNVYVDLSNVHPANTRVNLRNAQVWWKRLSTGVWTMGVNEDHPEVESYAEDYSSGPYPVDQRNEPDGTVSVKPVALRNAHGFCPWPRVSIDPLDVGGIVSVVEARLILDNAGGTDDRASAKWMVEAGADYYPDVTGPGITNNPGIGGGKFKYVHNAWKSYCFSTLTEAELRANPPAIDFSGTASGLWVDAGHVQGPVGPAGPQGVPGQDSTVPGPAGPAGSAATITAGTTTTGAPGTNAAVTNRGTSAAAIFDFTIPRGAVGQQGIQGSVGADGPQGPAGTPGSSGSAATVAAGTTTTGAPGTNASVVNTGTSSAAVFAFTIPRGATGTTGTQGVQGPAGTAGAAATIAVGPTTTSAPGSDAQVVNVGTSSAAIFNFTIPRGATGTQGPAGSTGPAGADGLPKDIADEGALLAKRAKLNFVGPGVVATDDAANNQTVVTISGGGTGNTNLDYKGDYVAGTYNDGDILIAPDGIAYMCTKNGVTTPPEPWPGIGIASAVGPKGDTGSQGIQGVKGDTGSTGSQGPAGVTNPFQLGHTWALVGDVSAISTLPSMFVPLRAGQAAVLVGIRAKIGSGTSVGVQVRRNGSNVGSVITVNTTAATTSLGNVALANNDELTLVLSAPSGTPSNFGATLVLEHTPA
jgi:hypothetical protein